MQGTSGLTRRDRGRLVVYQKYSHALIPTQAHTHTHSTPSAASSSVLYRRLMHEASPTQQNKKQTHLEDTVQQRAPTQNFTLHSGTPVFILLLQLLLHPFPIDRPNAKSTVALF